MTTMTKPTLVDRYVAVAVKGVPADQREDVAAELRASLDDAIDGLVEQGFTREDAQERACKDLGDPAALAAQYGGRSRFLIGPEYFSEYLLLLKILLSIVPPIIFCVAIVAAVIAGESAGQVIFGAIGVCFQVAVQIAFWVTLSFALMERAGTKPTELSWSPDKLPEIPNRRIGLGETVFSVSTIALAMWGLWYSQDHWLVNGVDGGQVPLVNPATWDFWIPALYVVLFASLLVEIAKYRVGYWTVRLAAVNTVVNAAISVIFIAVWVGGSVLNPAADVSDLVVSISGLLPWFVLIAAFDAGYGWWAVYRQRVELNVDAHTTSG